MLCIRDKPLIGYRNVFLNHFEKTSFNSEKLTYRSVKILSMIMPNTMTLCPLAFDLNTDLLRLSQ
jgi:hypothetical protein